MMHLSTDELFTPRGLFQFWEKSPSSAKSKKDMAVNKKVMQEQGGGMTADGQVQPSPYKTVH